VRKQAGKLLTAHTRPGAYTSHIQMDKRRARGWIVSDAANLHLHCDLAQRLELHARDIEVHGLAQHVLAVLRNALAARSQHAVGGWRTIGRYDVNVVTCPTASISLPHKIEQARIHLRRLVASPVAQHVIDLLKALRVELAVPLEDDIGTLFRMYEIKLQATGLGTCLACRYEKERHRQACRR